MSLQLSINPILDFTVTRKFGVYKNDTLEYELLTELEGQDAWTDYLDAMSNEGISVTYVAETDSWIVK